MRLLLALLLVFGSIIFIGFWTNHRLEASTDRLLEEIKSITEDVRQDNWQGAMEKTTGLEKAWKENEKWWTMILDHQEIDNIEFAMAKFKEYLASRDTALSRGELSVLQAMIKHIPEKENVSLKNIL